MPPIVAGINSFFRKLTQFQNHLTFGLHDLAGYFESLAKQGFQNNLIF